MRSTSQLCKATATTSSSLSSAGRIAKLRRTTTSSLSSTPTPTSTPLTTNPRSQLRYFNSSFNRTGSSSKQPSSTISNSNSTKYSSPSYQSEIAFRLLNAHSLSSSSSSTPSIRRPFNGSDELAGYKPAPQSSHFSFSDGPGKRFNNRASQFSRKNAYQKGGNGMSMREGPKGKGKAKANGRELESERRIQQLLSTPAHWSVLSGMAKDELNPGDFVELRRTGDVREGILLSSPLASSSNDQPQSTSHYLLLSSGDLMSFDSISDVLLRLPNYAPSSIVKLASISSKELSRVALSDGSRINAQAYDNSDVIRLDARAKLCTLIRELKSCSEQIRGEMESNLRGLIERQDGFGEMEVLNTRKAASLLFKGCHESLPALLTAHSLLVEKDDRFLVDPSTHRISTAFIIRPKKEVEEEENVRRWVRESLSKGGNGVSEGGKVLKDFKKKVEKVKEWISAERQRQLSSQPPLNNLSEYASKPPVPHIVSPIKSISPSLKFNANQLTIISFLKTFLGNRRTIQKREAAPETAVLLKYLLDASSTSTSHTIDDTLKQSDPESYWESLHSASQHGMHSDTSHALATEFLKSIGVFKPWENVSTLDNSLNSVIEAKEPSIRGKDGAFEVVDGLEDKREDFGQLPIYVIDDEGAFELDDGISISKVGSPQELSSVEDGKYWVHIHVADPTALISPTSELARFARKRFSSIYLLEKRLSLLPDELVNGFQGLGGAGLRETTANSLGGKGQRTLTFSALVNLEDQEVRVEDLKVQAGWVRNVRKLSYTEVGKAISSESSTSNSISEVESKDLKVLYTISQLLSAQRAATSYGASTKFVATIPFALADAKGLASITPPVSQFSSRHPTLPSLPNFYSGFPCFSVGPSESGTESSATSLAQSMVAEFMVLAGRITGSFASSRSLPLPFRGQQSPPNYQLQKLKDLADQYQGMIPDSEWVGADIVVKAGGHRIQAWEHFSMGIPAPSVNSGSILNNGYVRSTSPLRRFPDLFVHWQLKSALTSSTTKPLYSESDLLPQLPEFDRLDSRLKAYTRSAERSWFILYISRLLAFDPSNPVLGPHEAIVVLKGARINANSTAHVRVRVLGLGIPAECVWGLREGPPRLGEELKVRVKKAYMAGGTMALTVERIE